MLKQLAEAEAARAEKLGSAASSSEVQSRVNDAMERIVEQVGARAVRSAGNPPAPLGSRLWTLALHWGAGGLQRRQAALNPMPIHPPDQQSLS